jgi:chemotaxis protein MotD
MDAPGDRVAMGLGGDKLEHPVKAVPAGKDRGDGADMFGRSRNGRALPAADGAAGERGAGGAATGAELRATSAGFVPQPAGPVASPVQQIAERIAAEVTAAGGSARGASPAGSAGQPAGTQVKVLHIELQPADLGTIEVRLSLKHDALELKLEASRAESAALISRDKDALAGMLRSAGYLIDGLTVQIADADRSALTSQSGGQGTHTPQSSAQGQPGSSNPDAQSDRAGRQPEHDNRSNSAKRDDNGSEQRSQRPDGALYI